MMFFLNLKNAAIFLILSLSLVVTGFGGTQAEIVDLSFKRPPVSDSDVARTLKSLVKIQGTGQFCQDGLYLITHYGDREGLFQKENQEAIDNPMINQTWRFCSVFSKSAENSVIMGRNWDNQNVGSIIVNLYHPPGGYVSVSFTRSIDMGFGHKDLNHFKSSPFGKKLLLAPFYAYDGINEHGLAVSVAGVRQVNVKPRPDIPPLFVSYLVRKLLDGCKDIREAVKLTEGYVPFDLDINSLNTHLFVADASGQSVILEYDQEQWRKIYTDRAWQVLTNKPIYEVPDEKLKEKCWRYRSISDTLEKTGEKLDWQAGMKILQDVTQQGTTWSVVYSLTTRDLFFSIYQTWDRIYHLKPF